MGNAIHSMWVGLNAGAADVGQGLGLTLVWCVNHPLAAVPAAAVLVFTIARSLAE
jgi:hypothetical protein